MADPQRLVGLGAPVDHERKRRRARQHLHAGVANFDVAGCQLRVGGVGGPLADRAGHRQHVFRAHIGARPTRPSPAKPSVPVRPDFVTSRPARPSLTRPEHVGGQVHHALHDAGAVAQVDERQMLAVLTSASHPAANGHLTADVGSPQPAAPVGAHSSDHRRSHRRHSPDLGEPGSAEAAEESRSEPNGPLDAAVPAGPSAVPATAGALRAPESVTLEPARPGSS